MTEHAKLTIRDVAPFGGHRVSGPQPQHVRPGRHPSACASRDRNAGATLRVSSRAACAAARHRPSAGSSARSGSAACRISAGGGRLMTCCTRRADVVIAFASLGPHPDYKFGTVKRIDPKTGEAKVLYKEAN